MATIRGVHKGINDKALKNAIDNFCKETIHKAAVAGERLMREKRSSAVRTWYNSSSARAMNESTHYVRSKVKQNSDEFVITITSYVDEHEFEAIKKATSERDYYRNTYSNLAAWRYRHEIGNRGSDGRRGGTGYWTYMDREPSENNPLRTPIDMPYSIGEYMFNLPWEKGITGLPPYAKATGTGWRNTKTTRGKKGNLRSYVKKQLKKVWTNENLNKYM